MAESGSDSAKYVYGVVGSEAPAPKGIGIGDQPLGLIFDGEVAALVSDLPNDSLEAGRQELLTHSRVLEEEIEQTVVLPMRFGVVLPNDGAVREQLLVPFREELEAQLAEMEGKVEIAIKGIYDEAAVLREALDENPEIAKLRDSIKDKPEGATYYERIELGERIAVVLDDKRAAAGPQIIDRLAPHAVDVRAGDPVHERMAVNASFLVERERLAAFDKAVDEVGADYAGRIQLKYTGPLPPHSFVELGAGV